MRRSLLVLLMMAVLDIGWAAQDKTKENWALANEAYKENKYTEALRLYEGLLEEGYVFPALFYNIANIYYRQHKLGLAILYYEKALKLSPRDKAIQYNLQLAKAQQLDQIEPLPPFFLHRWRQNAQSLLTANTWSGIGLVFLWLGVAGLVLWILGADRQQRKRGFIGGVILLLISIIPFYLAASRGSYEKHPGTAILLEMEYGLRSAPEEGSKVLVPLHEGVKLVIVDQIGDWYKVQLEDGELGWLPQQVMGMI